jgi:hypothetical protein
VTSWLPYITGSGGALVVLVIGLYLIISGTLHTDREFSKVEAENAELQKAYDRQAEALGLERQRSDAATQAALVTNQLIGALTTLATDHRTAEKHEHQEAADKADARALAPLAGEGTAP